MSIRDLRERNIADKARQCRGDLGVYTDGSRLLVDVAVGDATALSYRKPPPPADEPADPQADASTASRRPRQHRRHHDDADQQNPAFPRLPGQSFAIEHRVREKKNKFRPFLGADVDNPRRFVPFVLEASRRTTWNRCGSLSGEEMLSS
jgi:hypothetical protein